MNTNTEINNVGTETHIRDVIGFKIEQNDTSIEKIKVPMIQRDYVQGLKENESKLDRFLNALFEAIKGTKQLSLDFVYGNITEDGTFEPIDGQQRLTTLALLNFYLLCKKESVDEIIKKNTFNHFTYATRQSAKNFCELLSKKEFIEYFKREITTNSAPRPSKIIEDYPKYFKEYDEDITILSMLGTLDKIHEKFNDENLSSENITKITFHILPMNNFNLSDDLYIKMNGRGKQLSNFDNFKADYFKWLKENPELVPDDTDIENLKIKFNTVYLDIFWDFAFDENGGETPKSEKLFFRFINRFVVGKYLLLWDDNNECEKLREKLATYLGCANDPKVDNFVDDFIDKIKSCFFDDKNKIEKDEAQYNDFQVYEFILCDNNMGLINILNNLCKLKNEPTNFKDGLGKILKPTWEEKIFPVFAEFEYKHLCIYNTIMSLLETNLSFEYIKKEITHLSRLVCNIAEQYQFVQGINRKTYKYVASRFKFIEGITDENADIYSLFLDNNQTDKEEEGERNLKIITQDEVKKCRYICEKGDLESVFIELEKLPKFKGVIGFSFEDNEEPAYLNPLQNKLECISKNLDLFTRALISQIENSCNLRNDKYDQDGTLQELVSRKHIREVAYEIVKADDLDKSIIEKHIRKHSKITPIDNYNNFSLIVNHEALYKTEEYKKARIYDYAKQKFGWWIYPKQTQEQRSYCPIKAAIRNIFKTVKERANIEDYDACVRSALNYKEPVWYNDNYINGNEVYFYCNDDPNGKKVTYSLYNEIFEYKGSNGSDIEKITYENLIKYFETVEKELEKFPSSPESFSAKLKEKIKDIIRDLKNGQNACSDEKKSIDATL